MRDDFWFTTKGEQLYAIAFARPEGRKILVKSLNNEPIRKIRMLGQRLYLNWKKTDAGVEIELPAFLAEGVGYALEVSLSDN